VGEEVASNIQSTSERIRCAAPRQWLYLFEDAGVVFSEARNRFAGLDAAGVAAYLAFEAGAAPADLQSIRSGHLPDVAAGEFEAGWLDMILALTQGGFPGEESSSETWPDPDSNPGIASPERSANIQLHGIPLRLDYPAGPGEELCRDCFRNCTASDLPVRWTLSSRPKCHGWAICINGREIFSLQHERQMGLGMLHAARSLLYAEGRYDVALHAGMIARDDCGLMLCAPREAGKSTLAAYLVAQGFDLIADEPALLDLETGTVAPLCLPISLKEGSWQVLREGWPQLDAAPIHVRSDGTRIRLTHPESWPSRPPRVTQIVFPRYAPTAAPEMEPLSRLHTLRLLNEGGILLAKRFSRDQFESLLEWLGRTAAYRMQYASLQDARLMLGEIRSMGR
jgi:hypothetical protein